MKELSLHILDIAQNSIRAEASHIHIRIEESGLRNSMRIIITDNGMGIPRKMLAEVTDPFITSRTVRKVGLGLPFLRQHAEIAGGKLKIDSVEGEGTRVEATFILNHIDRQPMGDIPGVIKILMLANPRIDFVYEHSTDLGEFKLDTCEIKDLFGIDSLTNNSLMEDIRNMTLQNLKSISVADPVQNAGLIYPGG